MKKGLKQLVLSGQRTLSNREKEIVMYRINGLSYRAIGKIYLVSHERIRQIHIKVGKILTYQSYKRSKNVNN